MEDIVDTDPVPAVETRLERVQSTASEGSGRGDGSVQSTASKGSCRGDGSAASSLPWSLTLEEQVHNLKENWKRVFSWKLAKIDFGNQFETYPWFKGVVSILRVHPCLDGLGFKIDDCLLGKFVSGVRMTSLDMAILMGDPKMVQKILERSSIPDNVINGLLVDTMRASKRFIKATLGDLKKNRFLYTPLHLAVVGGNRYIVDALLEKDVDVNVQNWFTETPIDLACKMENFDIVERLLAKDTKERKNSIHLAVREGAIHYLNELTSLDVNVVDNYKRTPLHYLATKHNSFDFMTEIIQYLAQYKLDLKALDDQDLSAFYVAVLFCNTELVIALLDSDFKDQIQLNKACNKKCGPPIQIAFEGGDNFEDIRTALMECDSIKDYMERLYRDRQVYVDAANAILVGAALIASVTFASWLQPPLSYTSYFGEEYSRFVAAPSTSDLNFVDVEHNITLRAFWIFNALSFYFAVGTVVCGARSVLPRSHLFIKKIVEKLRTNLLVTSILLACSVLFVIIAFAIAGTIVLTPLLKYQWYMIVPTIVGGMVCIISLIFLVKSMAENYSVNDSEILKQKESYLKDRGNLR